MNSSTPAQRPRNQVWDALADIFGAPTTATNRRLRGKITKSLQDAGADYDEIVARARTWPLHFPGATLTPTALEKWWDQLAKPPLRATPDQIRTVERRLETEEMRRRLDN